jgi:hypothetical protein
MTGCSPTTEKGEQTLVEPQQKEAAKEIEAEPKKAEVATAAIDIGAACKKYIGELMGRPADVMSVDYEEQGGALVGVSYRRQSDNKLWKYECTVAGENILWRGVDLFEPGEGPGRWRTEDAKPLSSV